MKDNNGNDYEPKNTDKPVIRCSVNGMLARGHAVCGSVTVGGKYCTRPYGDCDLQSLVSR